MSLNVKHCLKELTNNFHILFTNKMAKTPGTFQGLPKRKITPQGIRDSQKPNPLILKRETPYNMDY
jgi:hypothetical protein